MNTVLALSLLAFSTTEAKNFEGVLRIEIFAGSGDVRVRGGPSTAVRVEAELEGDCETKYAQTKGTLRVEVKNKGGGSCEASLRVDGPAALDVMTTTGSGGLKVTGTSGEIGFTIGSGDVTIDGAPRSVIGKTGSGDMSVRYRKAPAEGTLDLKTGSGDTRVMLPRDTAFSVMFQSGSGELKSALKETKGAKFSIMAKSGSGDLRIERAD